MKYLDGAELADYIKAQQAREVRSLVQSAHITPRLVIMQDNATELNKVYTKLKQAYADDIGAVCDLVSIDTSQLSDSIAEYNDDKDVHGIVVQLPINEPETTDDITSQIEPKKDIDGLGVKAEYDSATATAILWLLNGYNVSLQGKSIAVVGQGKLVGKPISDMLEDSGTAVERYDERTSDLTDKLNKADIIISAAGQPGLIKPEAVKNGAVVVDAGTSTEGERVVGDVDPKLYQRDDLIITPKKGGVGPVTIAALFGHLLQAARMVE